MWVGSSKKCVSQLTQLLIYFVDFGVKDEGDKSPSGRLVLALSRFPTLAIEVAQRKPALVVVTTISAALAAQRASATIPIVMTRLIDPVRQGLIASLARPGGGMDECPG
jgi:hypothetical protein